MGSDRITVLMNTFSIDEEKLVLFAVACFLSVSAVFLCCPEYTSRVPITSNLNDRDAASASPGSNPLKIHRPLPESEAGEIHDETNKVDPNFATYEELVDLPGVGPSTARALLSYRENHLLFSFDDIRKIKGIGPVKLNTLKKFLFFSRDKESDG